MAATEAVLPAVLQPWARLCGSAAEFEQVWQEVEEKQAQSVASKKRLADETRNFDRLSEAERLVGIPGLLKAYQVEIGSLSKRAKFAEAALSELLKGLHEAPAPGAVQEELQQLYATQAGPKASSTPGLEETLRQREQQVSKLAAVAADLEAELQTMKNQDVTVRRLQKYIKDLEAGSEVHFAEVRRQKDEEWSNKLEELRQELGVEREQQREAIAQLVQERERHDEELQRVRQEVLQEQRRAEEAALARGLEVDALSSDLEKAQAELERERLQRAELKALPTQESQGSVKVLQSLLDGAQQRGLSLEREAGELRRQLAEAEARAQGREADFQLERGELENDVAAKAAEVQGLREQLALRPSFDEVAALKQQLRNVETVELSDEGAAASDLERRLLQRQKVLEGQLSEGRVRASELASEGESLREKLRAAEDEGKDLRRLVERLEGELGSGGSGVGPAMSTPAAASEPASLETLLPAAGSEPSSTSREAMPSMLEIVTGQRDRLRERLGDLEQERDRWRSSAEQERKRAETLHQDNVKLLERARYLQSLQPKQGGGGVGRARGRNLGPDPDLESRYGAAYEDSLGPSNPWEHFREEEKARRVASLSAGERGLVMVGSALLSSKVARLFALGYLSAMHLLVFAVLLRLAQMHHNC